MLARAADFLVEDLGVNNMVGVNTKGTNADGAEFLVWSFKAGAEHWIPDTKRFDEEFGPNRRHFAIDDGNAPQSDADSSPYDSLLMGPLLREQQRQTQPFKGHPPPILA